MIRVMVSRGTVVHLAPGEDEVPICGRYDDERASDFMDVDDDEIPLCADCSRKSGWDLL